MVYYRKYRRTGRSYARRGKSGYSMYKLYKNRSSGSQARQIYGLNKKMRAIQRLTKPEIKIAPLVQDSLISSTGGATVNGVRIFGPISLTNLVPDSTAEVPQGSVQIDGRFARLQNVTMKGVFTYDVSDTINDLQRMVNYMRIIIVQTKTARSQAPTYNDILTTTTAGTSSTSGTPLNPFSMIRAPLKYGSSRVIKFLSDKSYMLSDTKQSVNIKTKLKYVRNWYSAPYEPGSKGEIFMFVMLYNQDTTTVDNRSISRFDFVSKCVYTDA